MSKKIQIIVVCAGIVYAAILFFGYNCSSIKPYEFKYNENKVHMEQLKIIDKIGDRI